MKLILFLAIIPFFCFSQGNKKEVIRIASIVGLSFVSGASWGGHETFVHHPDRMPESWNPQFWDNSQSWRNKYQGGLPENGPKYFGSTTFLVWTTDAKHLSATVHRVTLLGAGACITIGERRKWWRYAIDAGVSFVSFSAGFHSIYSIAFKK